MNHACKAQSLLVANKRNLLSIAFAAILCTATGCHSTMSNSQTESSQQDTATASHMVPPPGHGPYTGTVADWPLWFVQHNFGAFCYETYGCKVQYNGFNHVDEPDDVLQISSVSVGEKYPGNLDAGYLDIRNFPQPAAVTWRSKDGTPLKAKIDIAELFKDRLVRHNVPREDIPDEIGIGQTGIILEVNDRTINVYTRTFIPTKSFRTPGNPHSNYRDELIRVFSKTY